MTFSHINTACHIRFDKIIVIIFDFNYSEPFHIKSIKINNIIGMQRYQINPLRAHKSNRH